MKRSDIKRIIKEEIVNALRMQINEDFADPIAAELAKMSRKSKYDSPTFDALARTYDIAWDKVPEGSFHDITGDKRLAKDGLVFYISDRTEKTGPQYDQKIVPGLLAVTLNGKILSKTGGSHYSRRGVSSSPYGERSYKNQFAVSTDKSSRSSGIGQSVRGTMQFNKLVELADRMYRFDLESFRGGTKALKATRANLKLGAQTFNNPKAWADANRARYEKILSSRVGSKDQVDSLVKDSVEIINKAIQEGFSLTKLNQYNELVTDINGKEIKITDLTYLMNKIIERYSRYISYLQSAERDSGFGGENYYIRESKAIALEIKKMVIALKAGKV